VKITLHPIKDLGSVLVLSAHSTEVTTCVEKCVQHMLAVLLLVCRNLGGLHDMWVIVLKFLQSGMPSRLLVFQSAATPRVGLVWALCNCRV
jgi:hypothetical protein